MKLHQLYRHYDKSGHLLYVGQSICAVARLVAHGKSPWFALVAFIEIDNFNSAAALDLAEADAIATERPLYNQVQPLSQRIRGRMELEKLGVRERRPRGRPKITDARPWEVEGVSRRTWYRKNKSATPS